MVLMAEESKDWSIAAIYSVPEGASGLAFDGTYLYCGIYGSNGERIYQIDRTDGSYTLLFSGPQDDAYGLTFDGTHLWTTDHATNPAIAIEMDMSGSLVSQFNLPDRYMSGIAYDNGDFWVARYYSDPGHIYKLTNTGSIIKEFDAPDNQPWDLCMQDEFLWMADYWGDALYKIDTATGAMLETHASEGVDPAGIVWDGQFLWYCDNGPSSSEDYLYKIDLSGSGTPAIYVAETSHGYGIVTINESGTWNAAVHNVGTADLEISDLTFSGSSELSTTAVFPITITPTDNAIIPITWAPLAAGELNAVATIFSNDPLHSELNLNLTGNAVNPGPDIELSASSHDYGSVRTDAHTRWFLTISNAGNNVLHITDIFSDDFNFYVDEQVTFPFSIGVLSSVEIGVWFNPKMNSSYLASLSISSDDPDENPAIVSLSGSGNDQEWPIGDELWGYTITGGTDNSPKAITNIPDVTGDDVDDVIICSEDYYIRCFNGNSSGTADLLWEHEIYGGSVYDQLGLDIIEDIDEDGYADVIIGSAWGGRLVRALSGKTGDDIWTYYTNEYGDGGWVYSVDCSYDYNNDGTTDVLAATGDDATDTGPNRVFCLNGLTGSKIWERQIGAPSFNAIGIEDFNGDGQPDVLVGSSNFDETEARVFGLNGADGLILWTFIPSGSSVWALSQIDDINGDGIKDVAIGSFSLSTGTIYGLDPTNGGQLFIRGGFGPILGLEIMDDLNGDGYRDIVPAFSGASINAVDGYNGNIIWSQPLVDKPHHVARSTDVSGDGINDIFVGTLFTTNYCYFIDGIDGETLNSFDYGTPIDALAAIPDIVGDGSMEMVAGGRNGQVRCYSGGTSAVLNSPPYAPTIDGETSGSVNVSYTFDFLTTDPESNDIYYYVEWGDGQIQDWIGPYESNYMLKLDHTYTATGNFEIRSKARDTFNMEGPWSAVHPISISFNCGDANDDGKVNVSDAVYIINFVFSQGNPPDPLEVGDVNCDTKVNVSDAVYLINYVFSSGNPPCDTNNDGTPDC